MHIRGRSLFIGITESGKFSWNFLDFRGPSIEFSKSSKPVPVTIIFFETREAQIQTFSNSTIFNDLISDYFQQQNVVPEWELEYPYHFSIKVLKMELTN